MVLIRIELFLQIYKTESCRFHSLIHRHKLMLCLQDSCQTGLPQQVDCLTTHLSDAQRWRYPVKRLTQEYNKQACRLLLHTAFIVLNGKQKSCKYRIQSLRCDVTTELKLSLPTAKRTFLPLHHRAGLSVANSPRN